MQTPYNSPSSKHIHFSDDSDYESISDISDCFHTTEFKIMTIIDMNESSQKEYTQLETDFYQRMKMYFLKHKLHIDLKIYFLYR
jgi:hypothetical protein